MEQILKDLQARIYKLEASKSTDAEKTAISEAAKKQRQAQVTAAVKKFAANQTLQSKK